MTNFRVAIISLLSAFQAAPTPDVDAAPAPDAGSWAKDACDYSCKCEMDAEGRCVGDITCCQCGIENADGQCANVICGTCVGDGCEECVEPKHVDTTRDPTNAPSNTPSTNPTLAPINPTVGPTLSPTLTPTKSPTLSPTLSPTPDRLRAPTFVFVGNGGCRGSGGNEQFDYIHNNYASMGVEAILENCIDVCRPVTQFTQVLGIDFHNNGSTGTMGCNCFVPEGAITSGTAGQGNCPSYAAACSISGTATNRQGITKAVSNFPGGPDTRCYKNAYAFQLAGSGGYCRTSSNQPLDGVSLSPSKNPGLAPVTLESCMDACRTVPFAKLRGLDIGSDQSCNCRVEKHFLTSTRTGQGNCPSNAHLDGGCWLGGGSSNEVVGAGGGAGGSSDRRCYKNVGV